MESTRLFAFDGQEVQQQDLDIQGRTAALADDHVLAELLRMQPYDGLTYQKAIFPFGLRGKTSIAGVATNNATVTTSFNADGSVHIRPFRAIVGSRNQYFNPPPAPAGVVTNPVTDSNGLASWRDIRSGIYVGTSTSALQGSIALAPNSSGQARWDLIYATITVDSGQNNVVRRVKDPNSAGISTPNVPQYFSSPVTVAAVTGTPGTPAAKPALPADNPAAGTFNIALAYVRVPNGFSATSQVSAKDVRATTSTGALFQRPTSSVRVCSGNNDANNGAGGGASVFDTSGNPSYYDPTIAGFRPGVWMPPDWGGFEKFLGQIDCSSATIGNWSHATGGVVDDTIDWRSRFTICFAMVGTSANKFATDPLAAAPVLPYPASSDVKYGANGADVQMGQTIFPDAQMVAASATVFNVTQTMNSTLAAGSQVGLYVDPITGKLLFFNNGTAPLVKLFFWLMASGQMPNP